MSTLRDSKETQEKYWQDRAEKVILAAEKTADEMNADSAKLYVEVEKAIKKEVEAFVGRYSRDAGVTLEEARKALSKSELKSYLEQTQEYYNAIEATGYAFDPAYRQRLHRQLSLKSAVSRLEALQADVQWQVEKLAAQQQSSFKTGMSAVYEDSYLRTTFDFQQALGVASGFSSLNTRAIESAISTKWLGENYSSRIWANKDRLTLNLERIIPQGIALGRNPRVIAKEIQAALGVDKSNAERLALTEFNRIAGLGRLKGYQAARIDKYRVSAVLDHKTSEICEEMDGKVFNVNEYQVGITANPFHPRCRTVTVPNIPKDEFDEMYKRAIRLAQDEKGNIIEIPADISFSRWRKGLVPIDDGKVRYAA